MGALRLLFGYDGAMMTIYDLKPKFQNWLRPLVRKLYAWGVTANQVTVCAVAISVVLGVVLAFWGQHIGLYVLLPIWFFVRMALNAIDGMLAREFNQKSQLGAYLNELSDVVADAALYLPFALITGVWAPAVVLVVVLGVISEYAGVMGAVAGNGRRYDGPMGKSDRAFVFGTLALLLAFGWMNAIWFNAIMGFMALLLIWTIVNRVKKGLS